MQAQTAPSSLYPIPYQSGCAIAGCAEVLCFSLAIAQLFVPGGIPRIELSLQIGSGRRSVRLPFIAPPSSFSVFVLFKQHAPNTCRAVRSPDLQTFFNNARCLHSTAASQRWWTLWHHCMCHSSSATRITQACPTAGISLLGLP